MTDVLSPGIPTTTDLKLLPYEEFGRALAVDYHMHTEHTDGTATVRQMAEAAAGKGIDEILFTEHVRHSSTYYPSFVDEVRGVQDLNLTVRVGIETKAIDMEGRLDCSPQIASICDGIVASVHRPPEDVNGADPSWSKIEPNAALELEFKLAMAIVTKSRAHILGHPMGMVVTRFNLRPLEQLYELAEACRANDKAFELNTRYCANPDDWIDIVRRAGCKVSFGSDAHKASDVGSAWQIFMRQVTETP